MFNVIRIPAFNDNYIWLLRRGAAAVVVDPGDAQPVIELLKREGLSLAAILITHHHADHQGGIPALLAHCLCPVFGPAAESITGLTTALIGGESIHIDALDAAFQVIPVPGHTLGHLAYYSAGSLFCGDTLFGGGCGRLFEGTPAQMLDSLERLAALPDETAVYCAHEYTQANLRFAQAVEPGNLNLQERIEAVAIARAQGLPTVPSTIALEKATNPFLRSSEASVVFSVQNREPDRVPKISDALETFTALREWKNIY
jgi:hydroxyacylglutathione hydrolase